MRLVLSMHRFVICTASALRGDSTLISVRESPHSALCARAGPWRWAGAEGGYAVGLWPAFRAGILRWCCRGRCLHYARETRVLGSFSYPASADDPTGVVRVSAVRCERGAPTRSSTCRSLQLVGKIAENIRNNGRNCPNGTPL